MSTTQIHYSSWYQSVDPSRYLNTTKGSKMTNNKPPEFTLDPHSPYYLHPSDAPGAIITALKFDGKNFELWEKAVLTALTAKSKVAFIDGTITKPDTASGARPIEVNAWVIVNYMVTSWILNVIDPKLHASIAYAESAQSIWENIKRRYAVPNVPKVHQLKVDIASCKQGTLSVVEFFSKMMGLWSELDSYVKRPVCKCEAAKQYVQMIESDRVHQFLMGLDDDLYSNVRSQILALEPLPSLDKIFSMIQQEEHHKQVMKERDQRTDAVAAFAVTHADRRPDRVTCKHCGKLGHEATTCFDLVGYPANWGTRGGRSGRGRGRGGRGGGRQTSG